MSSGHIEQFLIDHNLAAMNDPVRACDNYSDDVEVMINHKVTGGTWEVEGGKNELCGYIKQSQAALTVTQASTNGHFENLKIDSSFPWYSATAHFDEINIINMQGLGTINSKTHETITLKRTLTGLIITSVKSVGGVQ